MDERTKVLICIGAATAANCAPCFEHYHARAKKADLSDDDIGEAVDLASQVKQGAHIAMRGAVKAIMGGPGEHAGRGADRGADSSSATCCG